MVEAKRLLEAVVVVAVIAAQHYDLKRGKKYNFVTKILSFVSPFLQVLNFKFLFCVF